MRIKDSINIVKTSAAVAHFTAADSDNEVNKFDSVIRISVEESIKTMVAGDIRGQYSLNEAEFLLFREMCLKIVEVDYQVNSGVVRGADINMPVVANVLLTLATLDDPGLVTFASLADHQPGQDIEDDYATQLLQRLNSSEQNLFLDIIDVVAAHISYELA